MADDYRNKGRYASDKNWDQSQQGNYRPSNYNRDDYGNVNYDHENDWRNMDRNRDANYGSANYGKTDRNYGSGGYSNTGQGREDDHRQDTGRGSYGNYSDSLGANYGGSRYGRREDWERRNAETGTGNYSNEYGRNYDTGYGSGNREDSGHDRNYGNRYNPGYGDRGYDDRERTSGQRNRYGGDTRNYGNMNQGGTDRGWWDKTRDEVSSWFGDDEAEHRRSMDSRMHTGYRGKGPKDYRRSEDRIREDVCDRFTDDDMLDATNIQVEVKGDEVVLSGTVNNREQKRRAEDLVESISGVRDIENRIRIDRGEGSVNKENL